MSGQAAFLFYWCTCVSTRLDTSPCSTSSTLPLLIIHGCSKSVFCMYMMFSLSVGNPAYTATAPRSWLAQKCSIFQEKRLPSVLRTETAWVLHTKGAPAGSGLLFEPSLTASIGLCGRDSVHREGGEVPTGEDAGEHLANVGVKAWVGNVGIKALVGRAERSQRVNMLDSFSQGGMGSKEKSRGVPILIFGPLPCWKSSIR